MKNFACGQENKITLNKYSSQFHFINEPFPPLQKMAGGVLNNQICFTLVIYLHQELFFQIPGFRGGKLAKV